MQYLKLIRDNTGTMDITPKIMDGHTTIHSSTVCYEMLTLSLHLPEASSQALVPSSQPPIPPSQPPI